MSWGNPWMLFALLLPAAAVWGVRRKQLHLKLRWPKMSRVSIGTTVQMVEARKSDPAYLIIAAVALGVIALARPQWGEQSQQSFSQSIEVLIALDLSRSMLTQDMPNQTARLRAAKLTVEQLLDGLKGENVGLVLFAGTSFVQVPMSPDYQIIRQFLPVLDPDYMPVGGSDFNGMLVAALEGFSQTDDRDRFLVVLSDGESTKPGLEPRIPELLRRGIHVIGVGFGTPATLQDLAMRTEGQYVTATTLTDAAAVRKLIKDTVESGRAGRVRNGNVAVGVERFQWFLVPAVLLSLLSLVREFRRYPRTRVVHRAAAFAMLVFMLIPLCVKAHHDEEIKGDPAERVRALSIHMGKWGYDPLDLKLLVETAMQFALNERARGRLPLAGVMHDAVDAVRMGRKLNPTLAQWDRYESQIHDLLAPLPVETKEQEPENNDLDHDDEDDEQNYKPVPLRKAKDKEGRDLFGQNTRSRSEFALGDLSGDETFAPQEPHGGRRTPPKPLQNPVPTAGATPADDPTMAEARKNFAIVVKGDSPGRVHQLLNGEGKRAVEQDW